MKIVTKYYLNKKSNKIVDEFYIKNDKLSLSDLLLKQTYKKCFNEYLQSKVLGNKKSEECLVCYDTTTMKYKVPCCDKQYVCLDCLSKMYNISDYKCMFCRKKLFTIEMFKVFREVHKHWLFKANNICYYLHSYNMICDVKDIKKLNNYNFEINFNGNIIQIYHDDQRNVYWFKDGQFLLLS